MAGRATSSAAARSKHLRTRAAGHVGQIIYNDGYLALFGQETHIYGDSYDGRCARFCATDNYLIYSIVSYVHRDFNGTIQSITRSACANGAFPANGMVYFTPTACGCTWRYLTTCNPGPSPA